MGALLGRRDRDASCSVDEGSRGRKLGVITHCSVENFTTGVPVEYSADTLPHRGERDASAKARGMISEATSIRVNRGVQDIHLEGCEAVCDLYFRQ